MIMYLYERVVYSSEIVIVFSPIAITQKFAVSRDIIDTFLPKVEASAAWLIQTRLIIQGQAMLHILSTHHSVIKCSGFDQVLMMYHQFWVLIKFYDVPPVLLQLKLMNNRYFHNS